MTITPPPVPLDPVVPDHPRRRLWALVLIVSTAALFGRCAHFGFINFDDPVYVRDNSILLHATLWAQLHWALTAVVSNNYHPVTLLVEVVIVRLFGPSATAFHVCSVLLHAVNVSLVFLLLCRCRKTELPALAVAVLWGWHPLRVESVAWVSELKDVLCGFFWLGSLLAFVRFSRTRRTTDYLVTAGLAAAACLSKSMAITLPITVLLIAWWPLEQAWHERGRLLLELLPLVLISLATGIATIVTQRSATQHLELVPLAARLKNAALSVGAYLAASAAPVRLAPFYPHPSFLHRNISAAWIVAIIIVILNSIVGWIYRKRAPATTAGWCWFLVTLLPVIGLVQVGEQARADRYTYVPSIGLTFGVVWLCTAAISKLPRLIGRAIATVLTVCVVVSLAVITFKQIGYWQSTRSLFEHTLAVTSDNPLALDLVAIEDLHIGARRPALEHAVSAYKLRPRSLMACVTLGQAFDANGQFPRAIELYRRALTLYPQDASLHNNLASDLLKIGNTAEAEQHFREAVRLNPSFAAAYANLGTVLAERQKLPEAVANWRMALRLDDALVYTRADLARAEALLGDVPAATVDFQLAVDRSNEPATDWLLAAAWLSATSQTTPPEQADRAVVDAQQALKLLKPDSPRRAFAFSALSAALARQGRYDDAIAAAERGVACQPGRDLSKMLKDQIVIYQAGRPFLLRRPTLPAPE